MIRRSPRSAFTLLELMLASLIAILLLSALYFAMDVTLRQTQESRDAVDIENLSSGVFTRLTVDLSASLGPMPPKSGGNTSSSDSSSSSTPAATTTPADPSTAATATDPTAAATDPTTTAPAPQAADIGFQAGIIGTEKQLTVFVTRMPGMLMSAKGLTQPPDANAPPQSDLCRVTYWLSSNGGLCRQERPLVTADGVRNSADPDLSDEAADVLVQEVKDVSFEYFDGSSWQSTWNPDGSQMSPDGVTSIGPPRAVRVTLTFNFPGARPSDPSYETTVSQIIAVRAAPGILTPAMISPSTDPGTTTADTTGSGASGTNGTGGAATAGGGAAASGGGAASGAKPAASTPTTGSSGTKSTGGAAMPSTATPSTGTKSTGGAAMPSTATPSTGTKSTGGSAPSTSTPTTGGTRGGK